MTFWGLPPGPLKELCSGYTWADPRPNVWNSFVFLNFYYCICLWEVCTNLFKSELRNKEGGPLFIFSKEVPPPTCILPNFSQIVWQRRWWWLLPTFPIIDLIFECHCLFKLTLSWYICLTGFPSHGAGWSWTAVPTWCVC